MSGKEDDAVVEALGGDGLVIEEKRMATVMQDDPLDIFPSDRPEEEVESD